MKKMMCLFFALASLLMFAIPAFAAAAEDSAPAEYDLLAPDGSEPAASSRVPVHVADTPMVPVDASGDAPVDESACREETSAPYQPPQRTPGRGEVADILQYWEDNGYPTYASYAFEAGGEMMDDGTICSYWEIGLVNASEAQKQEILELVSPTCLVEFKNCLFTHAQKQTAYDTITEMAVTDSNILEVIFIRNDDTVWVAVPEELAKEYAKYLIRDCGLGAVVSVTDENSLNAVADGDLLEGVMTAQGGRDAAASAVIGSSGIVPEARAGAPLHWIYLVLAVIAACTLTGFVLRRHFVPAAITENGTICIASTPLSRRQTEQAVRENVQAPDGSVYRNLLERLESENSMTGENT